MAGDFERLERALCAHLRDPERAPAPDGVDARGLGVYRRLVYRNLERFLASCFPVLRRLLDDRAWQALVRDFLRRHRARTPLFPRIPHEFLRFLEDADVTLDGLPFLRELTYYEWLELEVGQDPREVGDAPTEPGADPFTDVPVLSPLARPAAFRFPVHRLAPDFRPQAAPAEATYLVVFRDRRDAVGFLELNPVTARLLELVGRDEDVPGHELLARIAREMAHPDPAVVQAGGRVMLADLLARDVLAGARRAGRATRERG